MKYSFPYYTKLFIWLQVPLVLIVSVILFFAFSFLNLRMGYVIIPILLLTFTLYFVHRYLYVSVSFNENGVHYQSLFRSLMINYKDVEDLYIVEMSPSSISPEYQEYTTRPIGKLHKRSTYYVLIGNIDHFPVAKHFPLFRPIRSKGTYRYITVQYQPEMVDMLNKIYSKLKSNNNLLYN